VHAYQFVCANVNSRMPVGLAPRVRSLKFYIMMQCVCVCVRACELQGVIVIGVPLDMLDHAFNLAGW